MLKVLLLFVPILFTNCFFPHVYHDQERVLVHGIDITSTLEIARAELEEGGFDASLTVWAIRDQKVTVEDADNVSELYFEFIDKVAAENNRTTADFGVWHLAWAISNLYRNGDAEIKARLERAYIDALKRPENLTQFKDVAAEHVNGNKVYMGDIHDIARSYACSHIVAPGNKKYLQSLDQYKKSRDKKP